MSPLPFLLTLSSVLFAIGLFAVLSRRNAILILVGIELMLNAGNLNFIAFWRFSPHPDPVAAPVFVLFSIAVAAAEAAVGLAIILLLFRHTRTSRINQLNSLRG